MSYKLPKNKSKKFFKFIVFDTVSGEVIFDSYKELVKFKTLKACKRDAESFKLMTDSEVILFYKITVEEELVGK
jgi:hypothetical protein